MMNFKNVSNMNLKAMKRPLKWLALWKNEY
jgi:hypothetical protein